MSEQQEQPATSRSAMEKVRPRLEVLARERSIVPLKDLFWSDLEYERVNDTLSRNGWRADTADYLAEDPILLASGGERCISISLTLAYRIGPKQDERDGLVAMLCCRTCRE